MPCRDGGPPYNSELEMQKKLDSLTRMLCNACKQLGESVYSDAELAAWWNNHLQEDQRRITYEQRRAKELLEKQEALNKLTEAEKKLLGLK